MYHLKHHLTTVQQSRRLIEIGVPVDTADFCILNTEFYVEIYFLIKPYSQHIPKEDEDIYVPCWSVGRLAELINILTENTESINLSLTDDFVEFCISLLEVMKENPYGEIDFSRLNDVSF